MVRPLWVVEQVDAEASSREIPALARELGLPTLVARLLWQRGVREPSRARKFLSPRLADLSPPEGLPNVDTAAERLARALREGERIAVCGDYDVDGMTGTAVLVRFFRLAGGDVTWSIPNRESDGYGLSVAGIEDLAERGVKVIVTVDNGITALEPIARARALGMSVVITDHHLPGATLPDACIIVNPHLDESVDATAMPCGCALAFKLAWAIADRMRDMLRGEKRAALRAFLRDAVGLAALATVTDVVPLLGENRIMVTAGLGSLRSSSHPGIQALLSIAGVGNLPLTTEDVGFRIGPRLNAAGRLSKPELVVELLTESDPKRCRELAAELDRANALRKDIEKGVVKQAIAEAEALLASGDRKSLVVWGEDWHQGVIGIVAARLVDRFHKPSVVIGLADGMGRGSCRTPPDVHLQQALATCDEHLLRHGGHAMAAGCEIDAGDVEAFRDAFEAAVESQLEDRSAARTLRIDAVTDVDDWNLGAVQQMTRLAPFGSHNPEPVFLVPRAQVAGRPRLMGPASDHLSFALQQTGGAIRVVAFRRADLYDLASSGDELDLAVTPVLNDWRGTRTPEFRLVDMQKHDPRRTQS